MLSADSRRGLRRCGSLLLGQRLRQPGEAGQACIAAHGQVVECTQGEEAGGEAEFVCRALAEGGVRFGCILCRRADAIVAVGSGYFAAGKELIKARPAPLES